MGKVISYSLEIDVSDSNNKLRLLITESCIF